jgi:hypothetical protein
MKYYENDFRQFTADIDYWLNPNNTYRVVFIQVPIFYMGVNWALFTSPRQSQASWFVITGRDFEVDAHGTGGIQGNGQVRNTAAPSTVRFNRVLLSPGGNISLPTQKQTGTGVQFR